LDTLDRKRLAYRALGATYLDTLDRKRLAKHTVQRLEAPGYEVTLTPKEVSA
jgi:Fe-S oxidoreductase